MFRIGNKTTQALRETKWTGQTIEVLDDEDPIPRSPVPQPPVIKEEPQRKKTPKESSRKPVKQEPRRTAYPKYPMISDTPLKLPTAEEFVRFGLANGDSVGPPRTKAQEGPRIKACHVHDVRFGRGKRRDFASLRLSFCTSLRATCHNSRLFRFRPNIHRTPR